MLFRFLSDLIWLPTGLLPTRALRWEHIDNDTARAVLRDESTVVQATFHVNSIGQIDRITTNSKYRDGRSGFEQTQFTLECKNYQEVEGIMIHPQQNLSVNRFQIIKKREFTIISNQMRFAFH